MRLTLYQEAFLLIEGQGQVVEGTIHIKATAITKNPTFAEHMPNLTTSTRILSIWLGTSNKSFHSLNT